ncbi:MAG: HzsA-related protein [Planctomycetota bacterium]|jgi:hypothetical protein
MKRAVLSIVVCLIFTTFGIAAVGDGVEVSHCFDDLLDGCGNSHDASLVNASLSSGIVYFDGSGDYVNVGSGTWSSNPCDGSSDFTIAIAYAQNTSGRQMLACIGEPSGGSGHLSIFTNDNGQLLDSWYVGGTYGIGQFSGLSFSFSDGSMHYCFITYNAGTDLVQLYALDSGSAVAGPSDTLGINTTGSGMYPRLGMGHTPVEDDIGPPGEGEYSHLNGEISLFAMWNRILTPAEMEDVEDLCGPPVPDEEPPSPNPAIWEVKPYGSSTSGITMKAKVSEDRTDPVEYYFEETSGKRGGSHSGWTIYSTYTDLVGEHAEYTYRVRTRDSVEPPNVGDWSTSESATGQDPFETIGFDEILFNQRLSFANDHFYTEFINYNPSGLFRSDNGIYRYNLNTQTVTPVITSADMPGSGTGVFYRFDLDWDASRIVFDYKNSITEGYRIWMCDIDGSNLTQITTTPPDEAGNIAEYWMPGLFGEMDTYNYHYDDMHPCFTQEDTIIFTSTRCKYTTLCNDVGVLTTPVLHRINLDGTGLEKLTDSPVSEFAPSMMSDGRVVYTRWEYVDKDSLYCKAGYAMNPDGTHVNEIFGLDQHSPPTVNYFRQVPDNPNKFVCVGAPHYWQGDNLGPILLIDRTKEVRTHEDPGNPTSGPAVTYLTPYVHIWQEPGWNFWIGSSWVEDTSGTSGSLYTTPYPIDEYRFLVTCKYEPSDPWDTRDAYDIYLIDGISNHHEKIVSRTGTSCWNPYPLKPRKKPMKINALKFPAHLLPNGNPNQGLALVTDVYKGMDGVARGDVKYLRINIQKSRPWSAHKINVWGGEGDVLHATSWWSALWPRVQLGIVPVEDDGSAYFVVPSDQNIFMQALDSEYRELQRERTYINFRPGEFRSCIGCHERSGEAPTPPFGSGEIPMALQNPPVIPGPMPGEAAGTGDWAGWGVKVLHYPYDIQPIFDSKCVSCHFIGGQEPFLTNDITEAYTVSFEELADGWYCGPLVNENNDYMDNDLTEYKQPKYFGCHNSYLAYWLYNDPDHRARLTDQELRTIFRWIDTNYSFYGTYYGRHHSDHSGDPDFRRMPTVEEALSNVAPSWHN